MGRCGWSDKAYSQNARFAASCPLGCPPCFIASFQNVFSFGQQRSPGGSESHTEITAHEQLRTDFFL
jgi:hypothetical protein